MRYVKLVSVVLVPVVGLVLLASCTGVLPILGIPAPDVWYRLDVEAEGGKKDSNEVIKAKEVTK